MIARNLLVPVYSWILLGATAATPARGFAAATIRRSCALAPTSSRGHLAVVLDLRGGEGLDIHPGQQGDHQRNERSSLDPGCRRLVEASALPMSSILSACAGFYTTQIQQAPIRTKSLTAALIFGLSDYLAQRLERPRKPDKHQASPVAALDAKRLWTSVMVGLLYYGPAAHYWYETIFRILPGAGLASTLQKAALGQIVFGPAFTCVFFAASLWRSGKLTPQAWLRKVRDDLPGAWAAGLGFWPLVDLISYSAIPKDYIPLFVNACSLVWTIYLSLVANR